jgi:hypothetical protein
MVLIAHADDHSMSGIIQSGHWLGVRFSATWECPPAFLSPMPSRISWARNYNHCDNRLHLMMSFALSVLAMGREVQA